MTLTDLEQIELMLRRVLPEMIEKALHLNQKPVISGKFMQELEKSKQEYQRKASLPPKRQAKAPAG